MEAIQLKNGTEEADALVAATMSSLRTLSEQRPLTFWELVQLCRNPDHNLFGASRADLEDRGLVENDGTVHGSIKNIVLSAVEGETLQEMWLVNPVKQD